MRRTIVGMGLAGAMAALGIVWTTAPAQAAGDEKTYVLTAGQWGASQTAAVLAAGGTVAFSHERAGLAVAVSANPDFLSTALAGGAIAQGAEDMLVEWAKPLTAPDELAITQGDETFTHAMWNTTAVEAQGAWDAGCTGDGVRVAILDGGIHSAHVDLDANLDVAASRSFVPGQAFNSDTGTFWHGTHVAGIVAAEDNAIGTVGIAPEATIIGVKVLHNGSGSFAWIIQGILYAATPIAEGGAGADIINMSLGATFSKQGGAGVLVGALAKAVNYADRYGVLVVSAAANDGLDLDHMGPVTTLPAQSGSGIAVSATGPLGFALGATDFRRPASYTNYGNSVVWVAGPGGDFELPGTAVCSLPRVPSGVITVPCWVFDMVLSTSRGGATSTSSYSWAAGTSMAAPAVSAVAALAKQSHPGISLGALKALIAQSADDEGKNGNDPFYGKGFVNARRACTQ